MSGSSSDPKVLLHAIEAVYGVDQVPTPGANAILIRDEIRAPELEVMYAERNNAKAFFGRDQQIVVGRKINVGYDVEVAGSGAGGTAPKWGAVLRSCGFAEKVLAATHTNTAVAGAAGSITLHATASAVDAAYQYLTIRITGGTGAGQRRKIKSYVGATKVATPYENFSPAVDATSVYSIDAQVAYYPISAAIESASEYFYFGDAIHKLLGARGNVSLRWPNMEIPTFSFDYQGLYGGISDAAYPAAVLTGFQTPLGVNNQNTSLVSVHGFAAKLYNFDINVANEINYRNLPGAEDIDILDREPGGSIEIEKPLIATKDYPAAVLAGGLSSVGFVHGTVAGNIVEVDVVQSQLTAPKEGIIDKRVTWQFEVIAKPGELGNDELIITAR